MKPSPARSHSSFAFPSDGRSSSPPLARGFTLIELLVSLAIIGILSAIALPFYQNYVQKARFTSVLNTMDPVRQWSILELSRYPNVDPASVSSIATLLMVFPDTQTYTLQRQIYLTDGTQCAQLIASMFAGALMTTYSNPTRCDTIMSSWSYEFPAFPFKSMANQTNSTLIAFIQPSANGSSNLITLTMDPGWTSNNQGVGYNNLATYTATGQGSPAYLISGAAPAANPTSKELKWTINPVSPCKNFNGMSLC